MLLKDLSINNKGYYGIGASSCSFNCNFPQYLRITDIDDFGFVNNLNCSINPNEYPDYNKYFLSKYDIVFARTGNSAGRNYMYLGDEKKVVFAGFLIKFSIDPDKVNPLYVKYFCQSNKYWNNIQEIFTGSTRPNINEKTFSMLDIPLVSAELQQHIVDIIGSLDDKIESNNKIIEKIDKLGLSKYKTIKNDFIDFNDFANFEKGKEASSQNYMSEKNNENINFIRVKDLNSLTDTYISKTLDIPVAKPNDVLISFDGAIGRINYGLVGAYSSGIYKVIPKFTNDYGILYWSLKDNTNQQIMLEHTNGTTILHGSKSIKYLKIKKHLQDDIDYFNKIFDYSLNIKLQNKKLCKLKKLYLKKFFG